MLLTFAMAFCLTRRENMGTDGKVLVLLLGFCFLETGSCYGTQADLELPECWVADVGYHPNLKSSGNIRSDF